MGKKQRRKAEPRFSAFSSLDDRFSRIMQKAATLQTKGDTNINSTDRTSPIFGFASEKFCKHIN